MDFVQIIAAALGVGGTIGGALGTFFAVRQKTIIEVLRAGNEDYQKRVDQLEEDGARKDEEIAKLKHSVEQIQQERQMPLDQLTNMIRQNHAYQMDSLDKLGIIIDKLVENQIALTKAMKK